MREGEEGAGEGTDLSAHFTSVLERTKLPPHQKIDVMRRKLWEVQHPGEPLPEEADEELALVGGGREKDLLCPLTKLPLEEPMRKYLPPTTLAHPHSLSRNCGHCYSRAAISAYIRKKSNCPVAGCSARVSQRALEEAQDMARLVAEARRKGTLSAPQTLGDEDDVMQL